MSNHPMGNGFLLLFFEKLCIPIIILSTLALPGCHWKPIESQEVRGGVLATMRPTEEIESIRNPRFLTVEQAENLMDPEQQVLGFVAGGQPHAIAMRVMDEHEIVNSLPSSSVSASYTATW